MLYISLTGRTYLSLEGIGPLCVSGRRCRGHAVLRLVSLQNWRRSTLTNDDETVLEREESGTESILVSETSQDCQEQSVPLSSPATRFLMLSNNPHTTPLPCNPRLILFGLNAHTVCFFLLWNHTHTNAHMHTHSSVSTTLGIL